jgi:hypothetical protein
MQIGIVGDRWTEVRQADHDVTAARLNSQRPPRPIPETSCW